MRRLTSISVVLSTLLLISTISAQQPAGTAVPNFIRYGGTLKDVQGKAPASATTLGVTFSIYKQQDGGAPVWMETQNVTTDASGNYSVLLGSTSAAGLPADLFSQEEQRWLGVQVQGQAEQPRVLLVSVPYAFKAHEAETLGGKSVSDFVLANGANSSAIGSNASQSPSAPDTHPATSGSRKSADSGGPTNFSGSTADQIVGVTQSGTGVGVNVTAPAKGIVGTATAPSGTTYGVQGVVISTSGVGLIGTATSTTGSTYGLRGTSSSTSGTGVRGIATATSGSTTGVSAYVASSSGTAGVFNNAAGGRIISGQSNGVEAFRVDGSGNVNAATSYQIGSQRVLSLGNQRNSDLFIGVDAGNSSTAVEGNTFTGYKAGNSATTGAYNTFSGYLAGGGNTTGLGNTFTGAGAGRNITTQCCNVFTGYFAGYNSTFGGSNNTYVGFDAGMYDYGSSSNSYFGAYAGYNASGEFDTFVGAQAGYSEVDGNGEYNTAIGYAAQTPKGHYNTVLGSRAGKGPWASYGSNNIYIGNLGTNESDTIRIGGDMGAGDGPQTAAYVAGIYGSSVAGSGIAVYVDPHGQLGTTVSSLRFKEQVRDMGDSTSALMKLRPVTFLYKPEYDKGERTLQYGLIAEEVAQVYPELVAYGNDGQPYTVRYQYLSTMLLNEVQKQYRRAAGEAEVITRQEDQIEAQQRQIHSLQKQNEDFQQRLSRLEKLAGAQANIAGDATPSATGNK